MDPANLLGCTLWSASIVFETDKIGITLSLLRPSNCRTQGNVMWLKAKCSNLLRKEDRSRVDLHPFRIPRDTRATGAGVCVSAAGFYFGILEIDIDRLVATATPALSLSRSKGICLTTGRPNRIAYSFFYHQHPLPDR
jgi:hypothetical protein